MEHRGITYQIIGQRSQDTSQALNHTLATATILAPVERARKDKKDTGDIICNVEGDPLVQVFTQT